MTPAAIAVAGGPSSTAVALAQAGHDVTFVALDDLPPEEDQACRTAGVELEIAPDVDVRVTAPWLQDGYRLYRAIAGRPFAAVVFDGNAWDAYAAGRARETLSGLDATSIVIRLGTPGLQRLATEPFVPHHALGAAVTERLATGLADVIACAPVTHARLREHRWVVDAEVVETEDVETALTEALARARLVVRRSPPADEPLVSVVVPLHERTTFLPHCLDTLARQDYRRIEVVVADDGSTSPEVVSFLADLERRSWPWPLRVERLPHGGLAAARNGGWRAASGELILFLDDDDAAFDDLISRTVRARVAAGADIVVAGARTFEGEGPPRPRSGDRLTISLCDPGPLTLLGNHSGGPTCLWSRSWLERLHGFSPTPRVVEDWHILVRASLAGAQITTPPDPAWWYRRRPTSMFSADPYGALDDALLAMAALLAEPLPPEGRLLPHLAAGAYRELERARRAELARPASDPLASVRRAAARIRWRR